MKPNQPPHDKDLEARLQAWTVETPLPPAFQDQVWRRIAKAEAQIESPLWMTVYRALESLLTRPRVAYGYVVVLLAIGLGAGAWAAQRENSRLEATLGAQYVQSVDPYHAAH